jgi:hypothetical protein
MVLATVLEAKYKLIGHQQLHVNNDAIAPT